ncbi:CBASS cGAMP-activated phospholipase [Actinomycetospora sp. CA-101289]|uniref:CBASS cGAMP-activated phospholipase n=1 Tax=Actinomycetospora sp. CA-101289 TaxID=3239893 RepID=UPI003D985181
MPREGANDVRKILCIDGGGIKGVFPAAFLAALEENLEAPIGRYFDLIVGTSTGGILSLGLGLDYSARELLDFYIDDGAAIFPPRKRIARIRQLRRPLYDPGPLKSALVDVFGERKLGECRTRVVVPSLNLETGEVHVYKTSHHPRLVMDYKKRVVDVALATAAAPTYFPAHEDDVGAPLVDGGTWANNPAGAAVVEALGVLEWPPRQLRVLSIGCTSEPFDGKPRVRRRSGATHWIRHLTATFMAGQSSASIGTAQLLAGHENVHRVNPIVPPARYRLDNVGGIEGLRGLGYSEARKAAPTLDYMFKDLADRFLPYHRLET